MAPIDMYQPAISRSLAYLTDVSKILKISEKVERAVELSSLEYIANFGVKFRCGYYYITPGRNLIGFSRRSSGVRRSLSELQKFAF